MKLIIDGIEVNAVAGKSLYQMCEELGLFTGKLSTDPLAAKISGRALLNPYIDCLISPTINCLSGGETASNILF